MSDAGPGGRALKGFKRHLLAYVAVSVLLAAVNLLTAPERPWFLLFLVGWGAPLALHCAYAMGLFGRGGNEDE